MHSNLNSNKEESNDKIKDETQDRLYFLRKTQYVMHEFNSNIVNMLVIYFKRIKTFPKLLKHESNIYKLINLIKSLFMNELEVACFTILLDKIGDTFINTEHWFFLTVIGIIAKKICGTNKDLMLIINYFSRTDEKFLDELLPYLNDEKPKISIITEKISLKEINKRFIYLTKPINVYCPKNYIDINGIADKIIKMCHPYFINDNSSTNDRKKNKAPSKKIGKKNKSKSIVFLVTKPYQSFQYENYINNYVNNAEINLESINDIGNNINYSLDIFENKNIYDSDFSLSKLDSISSLIFDEI